jgi:hypothetical protein
LVGQPNGECWYCRVRNGTDCTGDTNRGGAVLDLLGCAWIRTGGFAGMSEVEILAVVSSTPPEYAGPLFAVIDVPTPAAAEPWLRYTTDGTEPACDSSALPMGLAVATAPATGGTAGGRVRVVLSPAFLPGGGASLGAGGVAFPALRARACGPNLNTSSGAQYNWSYWTVTLDLAALPPLMPGPVVSLTLSLAAAPGAGRLAEFRRRLCARLWPAAYFGDAEERCGYQLFIEILAPAGTGDGSSSSGGDGGWQLRLMVLMQSNGHAGRARLFIDEEIREPAVRAALGVLDALPFAAVVAPGPASKMNQGSEYGCVGHEDCADGLFCSANRWGSAVWGR